MEEAQTRSYEEADLEIADISTDSAGSRFAMDASQLPRE